MTGPSYSDLALTVTTRLVAQIEAGAGKWTMPWHRSPGLFDVRNAATGQLYRGANTIALAVASLDRSFPAGWWATYRQWSDLGAQVRRGEVGHRILKWVPGRTETDPAAEPERDLRLVPKVYTVFNAAQIDGWTAPSITPPSTTERAERADRWIDATGAHISYGHNHACYRPSVDRIELPAAGQFDDPASFYGTACHELVHWSGHPTRLARDLTGRFGDDAYAAEELVAELGAAIACAHLHITPTPRDDHAAYLASWLQILGADPKALFAVAATAQIAVDHLHQYSATGTTP